MLPNYLVAICCNVELDVVGSEQLGFAVLARPGS